LSTEGNQREDVGLIEQSAMMSSDWVIFGFRRTLPQHRIADRDLLEAWRFCFTADEGPAGFVNATINLRVAALERREYRTGADTK